MSQETPQSPSADKTLFSDAYDLDTQVRLLESVALGAASRYQERRAANAERFAEASRPHEEAVAQEIQADMRITWWVTQEVALKELGIDLDQIEERPEAWPDDLGALSVSTPGSASAPACVLSMAEVYLPMPRSFSGTAEPGPVY